MLPRSTIWVAALALSLLRATAESGGTAGVDVTWEGYSALSGGAHRGSGLHGLALVHSNYTAESTGDHASWSGYLSVLALAGQGPTGRYVGDFLAASNIEGHASLRLYSWWVEAADHDWSLRGGALLADEEFTGTDAGGNFLNSAFGWPAFISANTVNTGPAFFVAAPGLRLARTWGQSATWRLGVYDGDSFDSPTGDPHPTRHGLHYRVGGDQGWFLITEAAFTAGPRTRWTIGAWLHTADFADVRDDDTGQPFALTGREPARHRSNHGAYASVQHTLVGTTGKPGNLEAFVRGGFSPTDRNALGWALDTGLAWTGPLPGRPADTLALGLAHARFGSRYAQGAGWADPASPAPDFEQVIEASYTVVLTDHISLQPDCQYIRHPGGSTAQRDACVFLLRLNATY